MNSEEMRNIYDDSVISSLQQSVSAADPTDFPHSRIDFFNDGLPLEDPDPDYYQSISFEEMASALCADVIDLDGFAVVKNRFSPAYPELCRRLEKGLSELASFCVTRAVFEKRGFKFTKLNDLDINTFSGIAGYHFRKTHDAVSKTTNKNQQFWVQMLEMEFR